jgi:hypothetical protein
MNDQDPCGESRKCKRCDHQEEAEGKSELGVKQSVIRAPSHP